MKIAYGLAGEGRGHSTRAIPIVRELLRMGHDVQLFTCCDALEPLIENFGTQRIHEMPTPKFKYVNGKISSLGTAWDFAVFMAENRKRILTLASELHLGHYDLVISDFEPLLSRASQVANLPLILYNNQSFSQVCSLPLNLVTQTRKMELTCRFICPPANLTIVAVPIKAEYPIVSENVIITGPLIKEEVRGRLWKGGGDHIVLYVRESNVELFPIFREYAVKNNLKIYAYGNNNLVPMDEDDIIIRRTPSSLNFINDMLSSKLLITAGGAGVIGEAAYTGTPTIIIPEPRQPEQEMNGFLAERCYPNMAELKLNNFTLDELENKVSTLHGLGERQMEDGTEDVLRAILNFMKTVNIK